LENQNIESESEEEEEASDAATWQETSSEENSADDAEITVQPDSSFTEDDFATPTASPAIAPAPPTRSAFSALDQVLFGRSTRSHGPVEDVPLPRTPLERKKKS
jgi:hypothetical protein